MAQNRSERQSQNQSLPTPILAEVLRQASEPKDEGKDDGKMPVFWKVFGSTLLSITAMVAVTAYQSLSSNIAEVRNEMSSLSNDMHKEIARLAENQAELVKTEEAAAQIQGIWRNLKELQEDRKDLTTIKERCAALAEIHKAAEQDRHKLSQELQALREQRVQQEERRALAVELAALRERLAGLEGKQAVKPPVAPPAKAGGKRLPDAFWCGPPNPSEATRRIEQLFNQSEDLRQIELEWLKFWFTDQPSHLSVERVHGGIQ